MATKKLSRTSFVVCVWLTFSGLQFITPDSAPKGPWTRTEFALVNIEVLLLIVACYLGKLVDKSEED